MKIFRRLRIKYVEQNNFAPAIKQFVIVSKIIHSYRILNSWFEILIWTDGSAICFCFFQFRFLFPEFVYFSVELRNFEFVAKISLSLCNSYQEFFIQILTISGGFRALVSKTNVVT